MYVLFLLWCVDQSQFIREFSNESKNLNQLTLIQIIRTLLLKYAKMLKTKTLFDVYNSPDSSFLFLKIDFQFSIY